MNNMFDTVFTVMFVVAWIAGVVLATGWWKLLALVFPFYAWYLVIEKLMIYWGVV